MCYPLKQICEENSGRLNWQLITHSLDQSEYSKIAEAMGKKIPLPCIRGVHNKKKKIRHRL